MFGNGKWEYEGIGYRRIYGKMEMNDGICCEH